MCCLFFDISKAFDKVWWSGLLYKLIEMKIPVYILFWIKSFLSNRGFQVKINGKISSRGSIKAGVPQGAIISPLLFNLYINDIPKRNKSNVNGSELYADDLASFFIFKKRGNLEKTINKYLKEIEKWLVKWKFKMTAKKCSYIIFSNGKHKEESLRLELCNSLIPENDNPKFLGITFDNRLNFNEHIRIIRKKCFERLKIIRIISNKKWKLEEKTKFSIYKSLIGSIIDYASSIYSKISDQMDEHISVVQNSAIRYILRKKKETSRVKLNELACKYNLKTIKDRATELNVKYFLNAINFNNPLIIKLISEYKTGFTAREISRKTPLCLVRNKIKNFIV